LRPSRSCVHCIHGRDRLDPSCRAARIAAKQVLCEARFEHSLPRSWQGLVLVRLVLAESGQGVVHGFGTGVKIALFGCFGEPLHEVFDKRLFRRAACAFDDDAARDADHVLQLLDRFLEAG
jgi:hypothetical protein